MNFCLHIIDCFLQISCLADKSVYINCHVESNAFLISRRQAIVGILSLILNKMSVFRTSFITPWKFRIEVFLSQYSYTIDFIVHSKILANAENIETGI